MGIVKENGTTTTSDGPATAGAVTKPSVVNSGDVLVAWVSARVVNSTQTWTGPTGWVLVKTAGNAALNGAGALWYGIAGASEPASYTFGWSISANYSIGLVRFSGVDNTTPEDVAASTNGATSSATPTGLSITTVTDGAMLVFANAEDSAGVGYSAPSLTEEYTLGTAAAEFQYGLQATAGASGNKTVTLAAAKAWGAVLWALRPAGGAADPFPLPRPWIDRRWNRPILAR